MPESICREHRFITKTECAHPNFYRQHGALINFNDKYIFDIAGRDHRIPVSHVEYYTIAEDKWSTFVPSLNYTRFNHSGCTI